MLALLAHSARAGRNMIQRWSNRPFAGPPSGYVVARPLLACCWVLELLRPPDFPYVDFQEMNALDRSLLENTYIIKNGGW